jgi:uracil-DNA glycosylase
MTGRPLEPSWSRALAPALASPSFAALRAFVEEARRAGPVYPPPEDVFRAFDLTPFEAVKVVVLGQDPYHEPGQATGLAFAVPPGVPTPPSLRNIAKELAADLGGPVAVPDLTAWARQGVLLLNATLTVAAHCAGSHRGKGWEDLTDAAVRALSARGGPLVFILWGASARRKGALVDRTRHAVVESAHPSPLSASRGFFGSRPFSKTNAYLEAHGAAPIDWRARAT